MVFLKIFFSLTLSDLIKLSVIKSKKNWRKNKKRLKTTKCKFGEGPRTEASLNDGVVYITPPISYAQSVENEKK
jgi:hypothetical protein